MDKFKYEIILTFVIFALFITSSNLVRSGDGKILSDILDKRNETIQVFPGTEFCIERTISQGTKYVSPVYDDLNLTQIKLKDTQVIFWDENVTDKTIPYNYTYVGNCTDNLTEIDKLGNNKTPENITYLCNITETRYNYTYKIEKRNTTEITYTPIEFADFTKDKVSKSIREQEIDTRRKELPQKLQEHSKVGYLKADKTFAKDQVVEFCFKAPPFNSPVKGGSISFFTRDDYESTTWWNSSWVYCKNITTSIGYSDYSYQLILNSSNFNYSKINGSGSDIRIVNASCNGGGSVMPYWIQSWQNNSYSTLWFASDGTTTTAYSIYYGNSNAPYIGNINDTFVFGDDFDRVDSTTVGNGWVEDNAGTFQISKGLLNCTWNTADNKWITNTADMLNFSFMWETNWYAVATGSGDGGKRFWEITADSAIGTANTTGYYTNSEASKFVYYTGGSIVDTTWGYAGGIWYNSSTFFNISNGLWSHYRTDKTPLLQKTSGTLWGTCPKNSIRFNPYYSPSAIYINYTFIRKTNGIESVQTLGAEETEAPTGSIYYPTLSQLSMPLLPSSGLPVNITLNVSNRDGGTVCKAMIIFTGEDGELIQNTTETCVCNATCYAGIPAAQSWLGRNVYVNATPTNGSANGNGNSSVASAEVRLWINSDTTMTAGTYNCSGDSNGCIIINASSVALNCNNAIINGTDAANSYGLYNNQFNNTIISNCEFDNYYYGGYFKTSSTNTLSNITAKSNTQYGFFLYNLSNNNLITNINTNANGFEGFYLYNSSNNILSNITSNSNTAGGNTGIYVGASSNNNTFSNITANSNIYGIYIDLSHNNNFLSVTANLDTYGIALIDSINNSFTNLTANSNSQYGLSFTTSTNNTISNSSLTNNTIAGIFVFSSSANKIYNTLFNNTVNYLPSGIIYLNDWNITIQNGTRIFSNGTKIAGNYWANYSGGGYSEICSDSDTNGFCDFQYNLSANNVDYMPLSNKYLLDIIKPTVENATHTTTGGFTSNSLIYNQIMDTIRVDAADASGISYVNLSVICGSTTLVASQPMVLETGNTYNYSTDFTLSVAGTCVIYFGANDTLNNWNTSTTSTFTVSTQNQSLSSGWYGYGNKSILSAAEITDLSTWDYDIFEIEDSITNLDANWISILQSINNSYNANIKVGLNFLMNYNYSNSTKQTEIKNNITALWDDLKLDPYSTTVEYISFELVDDGLYTDEQKAASLNNLSESATSAMSNKFIVYSKSFNSTKLDTSYISFTTLFYNNKTTEGQLISRENELMRTTSSLNRIYIQSNSTLRTYAKSIQDNIITLLRGTPNPSTTLANSSVAEIDTTVNDLVIFNNRSNEITAYINVSNITGISGKDIWDTTHKLLLDVNTAGNFSVNVSGYSATLLFSEDLDHIQLTSLTSGSVYKGASSSTKGTNYTNGTSGGSWTMSGSLDAMIEISDPHFVRNKFTTAYPWINVSYVNNWSYDYAIIADKNNNEVDNVIHTHPSTKFFGYISVADYANTEAWYNTKTAEVDDWLAINGSMNLFIDGMDTGVAGVNFNAWMKNLTDYVKITKSRLLGLNTYTAYEQFCTWAAPGGFCMKESCVRRWNGTSPATPDAYDWENWGLELNKSRWYQSHNVQVLCQAFDNRTTDGSYMMLNYSIVQDIYFASLVLGYYPYTYVSQPDFNWMHDLWFYDAGTDLANDWSTNDNLTYFRRFSNGIVYFNTTSHHGWIDDGRVINNINLCFNLIDNSDAAGDEDDDFAFTVNGGSIYTIPATDVIWSSGGNWYCKNLSSTDYSTNGHYTIVMYMKNRGFPADGIAITWDDLSGKPLSNVDNLTGVHSFWDTVAGGSPYTWNNYPASKNWMVTIEVNESKKTSIDTSTKINQIVANTSSQTNITLNSTYKFPIEIWSNPVTLNINGFTNFTYWNGSQYFKMNITNDTSCDSNSPIFNTTSINGEIHKACYEQSAGTTIFRVAAPSLSARTYTISGGSAPVINSIQVIPDNDAIAVGTQISPICNSNKTANINVSVTDADGYADIANVSCRIWNSSNSYTTANYNLSLLLNYNDGSNTGYWNSTFNIPYNMLADNFTVNCTVNDSTPFTTTQQNASLFEVQTLSCAIYSGYPIIFGSGSPGNVINSTTGYGWSLNISNKGNVPVNLTVYGTNLSGASQNIDVSNASYGKDTTNFNSLAFTAAVVNSSLAVDTTNLNYWRISLPSPLLSGNYNGTVTYTVS